MNRIDWISHGVIALLVGGGLAATAEAAEPAAMARSLEREPFQETTVINLGGKDGPGVFSVALLGQCRAVNNENGVLMFMCLANGKALPVAVTVGENYGVVPGASK